MCKSKGYIGTRNRKSSLKRLHIQWVKVFRRVASLNSCKICVNTSIYMLNVKRINPPQNCSPTTAGKSDKLKTQPSIEAKTIVAGCMDKWFGEKRLWLFGNHLPLLPRRWELGTPHAWKRVCHRFAFDIFYSLIRSIAGNVQLFTIDWYCASLPERQTCTKCVSTDFWLTVFFLQVTLKATTVAMGRHLG